MFNQRKSLSTVFQKLRPASRLSGILATALVILGLWSAGNAYSQLVNASSWVDQFYGSDGNPTGYYEQACDGTTTEVGSLSGQYVVRTETWCSTGAQEMFCWYWNGSSWEPYGCYDSNGRLRIPIGLQ